MLTLTLTLDDYPDTNQGERDAARRALEEDVSRLEKQRAGLETQMVALRRELREAEALATQASLERDRQNNQLFIELNRT